MRTYQLGHVNKAMKPYINQTFKMSEKEIRNISHMSAWFQVEKPEQVLEVKIIGVHYRGFWFICEIQDRGQTLLRIGDVKRELNYLGY